MAYATGTTHYNLPQTVGTDKRDWADTNQAFNDIDAAIYGAVSDVATAGTAIEGLETRMGTAEENISDNAANITSLDTRMTTAEGAITSMSGRIDDVGSDLGDMICAYNEPTATSTHNYSIGEYFRYNDVLYRAIQAIAIGDTIVPDTNCTTTNVTSELLNIKNDIPDIGELTDLIAPTEDGSTSAHAYAIGDRIIHDGATYIVKYPIAIGDTLNSSNIALPTSEPLLIAKVTTGTIGNAIASIADLLPSKTGFDIKNAAFLIRLNNHLLWFNNVTDSAIWSAVSYVNNHEYVWNIYANSGSAIEVMDGAATNITSQNVTNLSLYYMG